jgi:multidrug efflux system outer membrane protein
MKKARCVILCSLGLLSGCNLAPKYVRPCYEYPLGWRQPIAEPCPDCVNMKWWEQFQDPVLNQMIELALLNNQDVKIAASRVLEFFFRYGVARADLFPQVEALASFERSKSSAAFSSPPLFENQYNLLLNLSYDLDFWGRLSNLTEAAFVDFLASIEARRNVVLTLVANVANGYLTLRQYDKQLEISQETVKSRESELKFARIRFEQGLVSEMDVKQALSEVEAAIAAVHILEIQIPQQENLLSVLLGQNPGPLVRGKDLYDLKLPSQLPASLPSEVILQRPDVIEAEQALIAAGARIGAARALFFPAITLTSQYGGQSMELGDLFNIPNRIWNYTVSAAQIVFDGGRIYSDLKESEAVRCEALHAYIKTMQTAFQDVNDALVDHQETQLVLKARKRRVEALESYYKFAQMRYQNGENDFLTVLDAERNLFQTQLDEAESQAHTFVSLINLYKAMGGGWVIDADGEAKKGGFCYTNRIPKSHENLTH